MTLQKEVDKLVNDSYKNDQVTRMSDNAHLEKRIILLENFLLNSIDTADQYFKDLEELKFKGK